jgi:hypothetical protein
MSAVFTYSYPFDLVRSQDWDFRVAVASYRACLECVRERDSWRRRSCDSEVVRKRIIRKDVCQILGASRGIGTEYRITLLRDNGFFLKERTAIGGCGQMGDARA